MGIQIKWMFLEPCVWSNVFKIDCSLDKGCVYKREVEGLCTGSSETVLLECKPKHIYDTERFASKQLFWNTYFIHSMYSYVTKLGNLKLMLKFY